MSSSSQSANRSQAGVMVAAPPAPSKPGWRQLEAGVTAGYNSVSVRDSGGLTMDWPYHFPRPADVIAREAERFRRLPPEEQVREVIGLAAFASRQLEASPNRAAIEARIEAEEAAWRRAHQEV